jgi:hypothetical protein
VEEKKGEVERWLDVMRGGTVLVGPRERLWKAIKSRIGRVAAAAGLHSFDLVALVSDRDVRVAGLLRRGPRLTGSPSQEEYIAFADVGVRVSLPARSS